VIKVIIATLKKNLARFCMHFAGLSPSGRLATYIATLLSPPYKKLGWLANYSPRGYIAPSASIYHDNFQYEKHIFIGDRVIIYEAKDGGAVHIGKGSKIHRDSIIETGAGGRVIIGADTHIQPRCQFSAYLGSILIGSGVQIAPNCAFYPYNHEFAADQPIKGQPLKTKGGIIIDDDAWLGVGVIVLDGVRIGKSAVVGAGAVVNRNVPDRTIVAGVPARVLKHQGELSVKAKDDRAISRAD
jgi:acetyltransferase-like isoleucine patch superfamily enzyme